LGATCVYVQPIPGELFLPLTRLLKQPLSGSDFSNSSFLLADLRGSHIGKVELSPDYLKPFAPDGNVGNLRILNAANFSHADFSQAKLQGLPLEDANFQDAIMPDDKPQQGL
jgi:uncharacterized protein YjbI with pentapeptide repeats